MLERNTLQEFADILKEELPDNELPPDRGIRYYIDTQGQLPKRSPRGFRMSIAEHKAHVHQVLEALRTHKLYLKPKKSKLFRNRVPFLGHVISHNKLAMDPRKIEVVKNWGKQ